MLNKFILQGTIEDIDARETGNAMIWIKTSKKEEAEITNAAIPSWYTSVVPVRFSKETWKNILNHRAKKLGKKPHELKDEEIFLPGVVYNLEGSIQGIKRLVEGKPFYTAEIIGARIFSDDD